MRLRFKFIFIGVSILFLTSCKYDFSQRAEDIFASKKWPQAIEKLANPKPDKLQTERILKQNKKGMLPVAVIDNGTDPYHPMLFDQIDWQTDNGEVTGFGFDILGNDSWAFPSMINPSLFAFGAEGLDKDGRIVGELNDPLAFMSQINERFIELLVSAINKTPSLKESVFTKLNRANFSIFGAYLVVLELEESPFNLKEYEKYFKRGNILKPADLKKEFFEERPPSETLGLQGLYNYFDIEGPWNAMDEKGHPSVSFISYYSAFEMPEEMYASFGAPDFLNILEQVFSEVDQEFSFVKAFDTYMNFIDLNSSGRGVLRIFDRKVSSLETLQTSWYKYYTNFTSMDPFRELMNLAAIQLDPLTWDQLIKGEVSFDELKSIEVLLLEEFDKAYAFNTFALERPEFSFSTKALVRKNLKDFEVYKNQALSYIRQRDFGELRRILDVDFEFKSLKVGEAYSKIGATLTHPFIDGSDLPGDDIDYSRSLTKKVQGDFDSHGTHTASTIAYYNDKILITPIRVVTVGQKRTSAYLETARSRFQVYFKKWLENEAVLQGVFDLLKPFFKDQTETLATDVRSMSSKEKNAVKQEIEDIAFVDLKKSSGGIFLSLEFFEQILESIEVVGEKKIPLANISLGEDFDQPPAIPNMEDTEALKKNAFEFLKYEMFKSLIAERVTEKAPGTLFFVAAGNEGQWIDARSKSFLPAVIFSPYFKTYEDRGYPKVANNHVDSILVVGSLQKDTENLSSFTNVIVRKGLNFVFAVGEDVEAGVQSLDQEGALLEFDKTYKSRVRPFSVPGEVESEDFLRALGQGDVIDSLPADKKRPALETLRNDFETNLTAIALYPMSALRTEYCARSTNCTMPMNGTSMATPNALGEFSDYLISELKSEAMEWNKDLYNKEGYKPLDLSVKLLDITVPLDEGLNLKGERLISNKTLTVKPEREALIPASKVTCNELLH